MSELFNRLRNSDPITKRRWLIGLTSGSMVIVLGIWIVYLTFVLEPANKEVAEADEQNFVASTLSSIGGAVSGFGETFSSFWGKVKEQFGQTNEVTITSSSTTQ